MIAEFVNQFTVLLAKFTATALMPTMVSVFAVGVLLKMFIHYISRKQDIVSKEIEVRVVRHHDDEFPESKSLNFPNLTKYLLNRTFNEYFILRKQNRRRKLDRTSSFMDRLFYVDVAAQQLFDDTVKHAGLYQKDEMPNAKAMANYAFTSNKYFNNLFGIIPLRVINQGLLVLPGIFIIAGIFGTFLGIVGGIPELKGMDPSNLEATKTVLGVFLDQMAFSMNTSIMGIFLSVCFTLINTLFSPKNLQKEAFTRYSHNLELIWRNSTSFHAKGGSYDEERSWEPPPIIELMKKDDDIEDATVAEDDDEYEYVDEDEYEDDEYEYEDDDEVEEDTVAEEMNAAPIITPYHGPAAETAHEVPADLPKLSVVEDEYEETVDDSEYEYEEDESEELNLNTEALDDYEDDDDDEGGVPSIPKAG